MHGNESTTTKAVFDLLNSLGASNPYTKSILEVCTIKIIPILNPDGALAYTRFNANDVDLNRDAQALSQPESRVLRAVFDDFKPDYCFNLHGQRTIYNVSGLNSPATISFLAPAQDEARNITSGRKIAMEIIGRMNSVLQSQIPGQVGLYDDTFNINCVGDTIQSKNVPSILFEAGHYHKDYARERTREFIYQSLFIAVDYIAKHNIDGKGYKPYLDIPQNDSRFLDLIISNIGPQPKGNDIGILYEEHLIDGKVEFIPKIEKISDLGDYFAHREINANNHEVLTHESKPISVAYENDFVLINNNKFSLKPENS